MSYLLGYFFYDERQHYIDSESNWVERRGEEDLPQPGEYIMLPFSDGLPKKYKILSVIPHQADYEGIEYTVIVRQV